MRGAGGEDAIRAAVGGARVADGGKPSIRRDRDLSRKECNDLGNAERLIRRYGDTLMYIPTVGYFAWTETHWSHEAGERAWLLRAQKVPKGIYDEAAAAKAEAEELTKQAE